MTNIANVDLTESPRGNNARRNITLRIQIAVVVIIATALLFALPRISNGPGGPSMFTGVMAFVMLISLCSAIGIWGGLGHWRWRWIPVAMITPAMGFLGCFAFDETVKEFHVFCLSIVIIVMLTTLGLRFWKGHLEYFDQGEVQQDALQFGIKHIFGWTTAVAVFIGIGQAVYPLMENASGSSGGSLGALLAVAGMGALISISVVINIWAMLGNRISSLKVIVLVGFVAIAAGLNSYMQRADHFFLWITVGSQFMMMLALLGLRLNGLRFVK